MLTVPLFDVFPRVCVFCWDAVAVLSFTGCWSSCWERLVQVACGRGCARSLLPASLTVSLLKLQALNPGCHSARGLAVYYSHSARGGSWQVSGGGGRGTHQPRNLCGRVSRSRLSLWRFSGGSSEPAGHARRRQSSVSACIPGAVWPFRRGPGTSRVPGPGSSVGGTGSGGPTRGFCWWRT